MHSTVYQLICIWAGFSAHGVWLDEGDRKDRSKSPNQRLKFSDTLVSLWCFSSPRGDMIHFSSSFDNFRIPCSPKSTFSAARLFVSEQWGHFFLCQKVAQKACFCCCCCFLVTRPFLSFWKRSLFTGCFLNTTNTLQKQIARIPFSKRNHNPIIAFSWGKIILAAFSERV